MSTHHPAEARDSLWTVAAAPLAWAAHFLLSYCTAAVWCAKLAGADRSFLAARIAIAVYTLVALAALAWLARWGFRHHHAFGDAPPHHVDSAQGRHRFVGFITLLLAGLSALAIAYSALAALLIGSCE